MRSSYQLYQLSLQQTAPTNCILNNKFDEWISLYYHLGESTPILRGIGSDFKFSHKSLMKILSAKRIVPDGKPHSAVSYGAILFAYAP